MKFDIFDSVKSQGQLCNNELFLAKTYDKSLLPLYKRIAMTTDKNEMQQLKKMLPGVTWQAHFPQGRRVNEDAEPSGLYMIDIDNLQEGEPSKIYNDKIAAKLKDCDILAVHITPSCKGLRVVAMCKPEFNTIEENQLWLAKQLGVKIDTACKDMARFSYLVPMPYFLYWDGSIWSRDAKAFVNTDPNTIVLPPIDWEKVDAIDTPEFEETTTTETTTTTPATEAATNRQDSPQISYRNLPLKVIANKWLELHGGLPTQGERNSTFFELATRMRYITDFNYKTIAACIPHCGLSETEILNICKSACKTQRSAQMPSDIKLVIRSLENPASTDLTDEQTYDDDDGVFTVNEEFMLRMPTLPIGLQESLQGMPEKVKMPILCGIMPLAMAYATDVKVKYCDGKYQRLNLMSIIWGKQASGKSCVKDVIDVWKRPMKEADALNRKAEDEFKKLRKNRKANEKLPDEPHKPILEVPITISCSTLLKRFKNAQGKHLFSFGEELDTLRKTNGAGSWSSKYDVYRLGFDNGEWGQDYNSDQAESGVVDVAYNWTVLGTRGAVDKCFKQDSVENGMSGRVLFAKMPSTKFEHMPMFGEKVELNEDKILQAVQILSNASGFIDTPRLRETIEKWCNDKADEAKRTEDDVLDTFRKRAAVIGFRCGVVFQLLECKGGILKESKPSIDFATLMADYALHYQTELFGQRLMEVVATISDEGRKTKNKSLFDELPEEFSFDMLTELKPDSKITALRMAIYRWKQNGYIKVLPSGNYKKC